MFVFRKPFRLTEFADQGDEFVIPDDLSTLSDEELSGLHEQAVSNFDQMYGDGSGLSDQDMEVLGRLTEGIEALAAEVADRQSQADERAEAAQGLAQRVRGEASVESGDEDDDDDEADDDDDESLIDEDDEDTDGSEDGELETAEASSEPEQPRGPVRVPMSTVRSRASRVATARADQDLAPTGIRDVMISAGEGLGQPVGTGVDFDEAGQMLNRQLQTFNAQRFENAERMGRPINERHSLVSIRRSIPSELQVHHNDPSHVNEVFDRAGDEKRLPGGSLTAAGGWCAPSEVIYDLVGEVESRDGLLSVPEIGAPRGGISFTQGIDFTELYSDVQANAFSFTEQDDIDGNYDGSGGDKPCFTIRCPEFQEHRLDVDGLCVTAGLLASRGYPEVLARTLRGVAVAHDHVLNGRMIEAMATQSTAVTMPAASGAVAPLMDAIELQVEHYKTSRRMARSTTLEAVFPFWVYGALRHDLSRRQGVDLINVPDSRVNAWFAQLGISPQFVYNWQSVDVGSDPASFTAWPDSIDFLLYAAGTWVRGVSDIITLDTIYDSVGLGQNNYTALFTEEAWFVAQRGLDSRKVTVGFSQPGVVADAASISWGGGTETTP